MTRLRAARLRLDSSDVGLRGFLYERATTPPVPSTTFSDLARAAYCRRQLYYARRDTDRGVPEAASVRMELAHRYPELRDATDAALRSAPIDRPPPAYRTALDALAGRDDWDALSTDYDRDVRLTGKDCHGIARKVLRTDPPVPTLVSPGTPPDRGVWKPQRVRSVAVAKALSWERERELSRVLVEYPAVGEVREVRLTTRNTALYRRTLRAVRGLNGPPARTRNRDKCDSCAYRERCGVRTRSLRSLLGL